MHRTRSGTPACGRSAAARTRSCSASCASTWARCLGRGSAARYGGGLAHALALRRHRTTARRARCASRQQVRAGHPLSTLRRGGTACECEGFVPLRNGGEGPRRRREGEVARPARLSSRFVIRGLRAHPRPRLGWPFCVIPGLAATGPASINWDRPACPPYCRSVTGTESGKCAPEPAAVIKTEGHLQASGRGAGQRSWPGGNLVRRGGGRVPRPGDKQ